MTKLKIEYVKRGTVQPHPDNPRTIDKDNDERLRRSLETFGFVEALVVWQNKIIGGNQRYRLSEELGYDDIPIVRRDDLTEQQALALMVALNNEELQGRYDNAMLGALLAQLETAGYDATMTGFSDAAIRDLTATAEATSLRDVDTKAPPDRVWVLLGVPVARYGEFAQFVETAAVMTDVIGPWAFVHADAKSTFPETGVPKNWVKDGARFSFRDTSSTDTTAIFRLQRRVAGGFFGSDVVTLVGDTGSSGDVKTAIAGRTTTEPLTVELTGSKFTDTWPIRDAPGAIPVAE